MRLALPVVKMSMKSHETSPSHCGWHSASGSQRTRSLPPPPRDIFLLRHLGLRHVRDPEAAGAEAEGCLGRTRWEGGGEAPELWRKSRAGGALAEPRPEARPPGSARGGGRAPACTAACSAGACTAGCRQRQAAAPDTSLRAREFARERSACHSGSASARDCLPLPGSGRHSTPSRCAPGAQAFGIPRVSAARRDSCQPELGLRRGAGGLCRAEPASAAAPSCGTARPAKAAL